MSWSSIRDFAEALEKRDDLVHVKTPVDPKYELGAIAKKCSEERLPALVFDNLKGFANCRIATNFMSTYSRLLLALRTDSSHYFEDLAERLSKRIPPKLKEGSIPCKEVIIPERRVDLSKIPVPIWSEGETNPYIDFGIFITTDPERGYNAGIARAAIVSKDTIHVWSNPQHHTRIFFESAKIRGEKRMDAAIVLGAPPSVMIAASNDFPIGDSELAVAGGLANSPIQVTKCETSDILVPVFTEIVIEGYFDCTRYASEGPFGEFTGFQAPAQKYGLVFKVRCVTHRENPIHYCFYNGKPVTEHHLVWRCLDEVVAQKELRLRFPFLKSLTLLPEGCRDFVLVMQVDSESNLHVQRPGYTKNLLLSAIAYFPRAKFIVAVDNKVDVHDLRDLIWALSTHVRPDTDIDIIRSAWTTPLDPSSDYGLSGKIFIDATAKKGFRGAASKIPAEILSLVEKKWKTYGIQQTMKRTKPK